MSAHFIIGIDLGTTNSVVSYASIQAETPTIEILPIPQMVGPGTLEELSSLPSFIYLAPNADEGFVLPWSDNHQLPDFVVGEWARKQAAETPDRTVSGAKSWLCYSKVDRTQAILPWGAPEDVNKISPVLAAQRYLEHLIAAWHYRFPSNPISDQFVVLTVPASFDASARELTRTAAVAAGLPANLTLLEEPQAAVYSWLAQSGDGWRKLVNVGDSLLVVDVGGGTTDLTLVSVAEESRELSLQRVAVGDHLLVGGDNMDLSLAYLASERFSEQGIQLDPWQSVSLWHACRMAKEKLLATDGPESVPVTIQGRGRKLIGGSLSIDLDRVSTRKVLLDGFLPQCELDTKVQRKRSSGFQQIGLPFETETGITRHIAEFLRKHGTENQPSHPTDILVNGGVFKSEALQTQLLNVLSKWFPEHPPKSLAGIRDLDHAVAKGAAYYGWAKQNGGVRIHGGTARSYYIGIETAGLAIPGAPRPLNALCVVPHGMEEGTEINVPSQEFGLIVGEPAIFRFFSSATRKDDRPGTLLRHISADELAETDSLEATLPNSEGEEGGYVPVTFHSVLTELGIFELWCVDSQSHNRWKLEFSVRDPEE